MSVGAVVDVRRWDAVAGADPEATYLGLVQRCAPIRRAASSGHARVTDPDHPRLLLRLERVHRAPLAARGRRRLLHRPRVLDRRTPRLPGRAPRPRARSAACSATAPAEVDALAAYERGYRGAFERYLRFLYFFYDHNTDPDSYFWTARRLLEHSPSALDARTAFVRLMSGRRRLGRTARNARARARALGGGHSTRPRRHRARWRRPARSHHRTPDRARSPPVRACPARLGESGTQPRSCCAARSVLRGDRHRRRRARRRGRRPVLPSRCRSSRRRGRRRGSPPGDRHLAAQRGQLRVARHDLVSPALPARRRRLPRQSATAPIVLGGSAFTTMPAYYLPTLGVPYGIVGEGEAAFPALLERLAAGASPDGLGGIAWPRRRARPHHPLRHGSPPSTPCAPTGAGSTSTRYFERGGMANLQTKRGCHFKCTFCAYPVIEGRGMRTRDPALVAAEVRSCSTTTGSTSSSSSTASSTPRAAMPNAWRTRSVRSGAGFAGRASSDPATSRAELADRMMEAGCQSVDFGTDAAAPATLRGLPQELHRRDVLAASARVPRARLALLPQPRVRRRGRDLGHGRRDHRTSWTRAARRP